MSPSISTFWDVNNDPLAQAKKQAALLNCPNKTSRQIADCLMQKGAQEIASTYGDMLVNTLFILFLNLKVAHEYILAGLVQSE
jgi:hypothetical protein